MPISVSRCWGCHSAYLAARQVKLPNLLPYLYLGSQSRSEQNVSPCMVRHEELGCRILAVQEQWAVLISQGYLHQEPGALLLPLGCIGVCALIYVSDSGSNKIRSHIWLVMCERPAHPGLHYMLGRYYQPTLQSAVLTRLLWVSVHHCVRCYGLRYAVRLGKHTTEWLVVLVLQVYKTESPVEAINKHP